MGTLYVVATPIGNLGDMTPRAIEVLRHVNVIAAEDTRHSATLIREFSISTPLVSYHRHNERSREASLMEELERGDVAVISDAGTPAIADPGHSLVQEAIRRGHGVVPVPGASALLAAVSASGIVPGAFLFVGFLPRTGEERQVAISRALASGVPFVLFESPLRTADTLHELATSNPDRSCVLARELTKLHEEFLRGSVAEIARKCSEKPPRGEVVIVIGEPSQADESSQDDSGRLARTLLEEGLKPSKAARELAAISGMSGERAYAVVRETRRRMMATGEERPGGGGAS